MKITITRPLTWNKKPQDETNPYRADVEGTEVGKGKTRADATQSARENIIWLAANHRTETVLYRGLVAVVRPSPYGYVVDGVHRPTPKNFGLSWAGPMSAPIRSYEDAEQYARMALAQVGHVTGETDSILFPWSEGEKFRAWAKQNNEFCSRYDYATDTLKYTDIQAHSYAGRNPAMRTLWQNVPAPAQETTQ